MCRENQCSRKPTEAYRVIEECSPGPYLELFARDERPGWVQWGDELGQEVPSYAAAYSHSEEAEPGSLQTLPGLGI